MSTGYMDIILYSYIYIEERIHPGFSLHCSNLLKYYRLIAFQLHTMYPYRQYIRYAEISIGYSFTLRLLSPEQSGSSIANNALAHITFSANTTFSYEYRSVRYCRHNECNPMYMCNERGAM